MTTHLECTTHPEGHDIPTGQKFTDCMNLLGRVIIDNVDSDGLTYIYESAGDPNAVKRVKVGETLTGNKAKLPARIISISVST